MSGFSVFRSAIVTALGGSEIASLIRRKKKYAINGSTISVAWFATTLSVLEWFKKSLYGHFLAVKTPCVWEIKYSLNLNNWTCYSLAIHLCENTDQPLKKSKRLGLNLKKICSEFESTSMLQGRIHKEYRGYINFLYIYELYITESHNSCTP